MYGNQINFTYSPQNVFLHQLVFPKRPVLFRTIDWLNLLSCTLHKVQNSILVVYEMVLQSLFTVNIIIKISMHQLWRLRLLPRKYMLGYVFLIKIT